MAIAQTKYLVVFIFEGQNYWKLRFFRTEKRYESFYKSTIWSYKYV